MISIAKLDRPLRIWSLLTVSLLTCVTVAAADNVEFQRDIRPLLSAACLHCHGPDEDARESDLRLDTQAGLSSMLVPGDPEASKLLRRVMSVDPDEQMPPPDSGKSLTAAQRDLIRQWIMEGAKWRRHWSFASPHRPELPSVRNLDWVRNPIDAFVLSRLESEGLAPAESADKRTLARRVSFDLTGLPPTIEQVSAFLADTSAEAYQRFVDQLLDSNHYGERMAMVWLDAARYADTDGFQADATRSNWPWRDWVVDAYNQNMPFDEFTQLQFAGDLLPDASPDQVLATCFHRNHMTNGEGGRDPEESRVDYVIDRVNTMGTVWLGLTLGCCQCHSHKYDPITQAEYYQLSAFFNSIDEDGKAGSAAKPYLDYQSVHVQEGLQQARTWLQRKQQALESAEAHAMKEFNGWLHNYTDRMKQSGTHSSWRRAEVVRAATTGGSRLRQTQQLEFVLDGVNPQHDDYVLAFAADHSRVTGMRLRVLPGAANGLLSEGQDGQIILTNLKISIATQGRNTLHAVEVAQVRADYEGKKSGAREYGSVADVLDDDPRTGWSTDGSDPKEARTAVFAFRESVRLQPNEELVVELRHRSLRGYANIRRFAIEFTDEAAPANATLGQTPLETLASRGGEVGRLTEDELAGLREQFFTDQPEVMRARARVRAAQDRVSNYERSAEPVKVMVLRERDQPRDTHVLKRGVWDQPGEAVDVGVPAALSSWPDRVKRDRLGLAKWLTDTSNPLTARVAVNRYWQLYFGRGLVGSPEDFGAQGEPPTHPDLLDWLAVEFMDSGWDVKHIQRLIVTSATYRQRSEVTPEQMAADPENRLLARGSRFRLPSWMIRDAVLSAAELLDDRRGGPPVFPYQPPGAWLASTMGRFQYEPSVGSDLYRRSLYSFWRRSVSPSGMFDAASRLVCQVRAVRTNTPLHSLVLMNDLSFIEAARVLASRCMTSQLEETDRINEMFLRVLSRPATGAELASLTEQLGITQSFYDAHPEAAAELIGIGQTPVDSSLDASELAAYLVVAHTIFNLDEAITRE